MASVFALDQLSPTTPMSIMASARAGFSRDTPIVISDEDSDIIILDNTPASSGTRQLHRGGPAHNTDASRTMHEHSQPTAPTLRDGDPGLRLLRRMDNIPDVEMGCLQSSSPTGRWHPDLPFFAHLRTCFDFLQARDRLPRI